MSYQFEDDSAMDELLARQLDRHKKQQPSMVRPGQSAATARPSTSASLIRPNTAATSLTKQPTVVERDPNQTFSLQLAEDMAPSRGKLASWLERDNAKQTRREPVMGAESEPVFRVSNESRSSPVHVEPDSRLEANLAELDKNLAEPQLQEMSKQRLVQLILEQVVPSLHQLRQAVGQHSSAEFERLSAELQSERNQLELAELRHQEQLKLAEQKWAQSNRQLESRLESSETELARLMASQREHLEKLGEQYQTNLARFSENYEQRLRDQQARFDELLERRDAMHKLELDSKLNVNFDLAKLETVQAEWRRALERTIEQLSGQFKSIESVLDKQAHQVNGTNSQLIERTRQLCEHYEKHDDSNRKLEQLADGLGELVPKFAANQQEGELVLSGARDRLAQLAASTSALEKREQALEGIRQELDALKEQLQAQKLQFAMDANRAALKEERLDELIKSNADRDKKLDEQRSRQLEEQAHLQTKRVHLEERWCELKEQNYSLHLHRKRLTSDKEELARAQMELEQARANLKSQRAQATEESTRLEALRSRAGREMGQLRRLQRSLVCSLCMNRLFDNDNSSSSNNNNNNTLQTIDQLDVELSAPLGRLNLYRKQANASQPEGQTQQKVFDVSLRKLVERDTRLAAAESKYVELLAGTN